MPHENEDFKLLIMSLNGLKQHETVKDQVFAGWGAVWRHIPTWRNWWCLTSVPSEERL